MVLTKFLTKFSVCAFLFAATACVAQNGSSLMSQAWQAFNGRQPIHSISLTTNAHYVAGSDDETGTGQLVANADGSYSLTLNLQSGTRTETLTSFVSGQQGTWSGYDGVVRQTALQNSVLPVAWFMPSVALFGGQQPSTITTTVSSGSSLNQSNSEPSNQDPTGSALFAHVSSVSLSYDPATSLPSSMIYTIHPDTAASQDIPVQVNYLSYQTINGVAVPAEIQKFINGTLALDLTITQATIQ